MRRLLSDAAGTVDRALADAVTIGRWRKRRDRAEGLGHEQRMQWLNRIRGIYDRPEHYDPPHAFFVGEGALDVREAVVRSFGDTGRVADVRWNSRARVHCSDVESPYRACVQNRDAAARLILHNGSPRPALVLIHGYRGGAYGFEERVWPIRWLFDIGFDLALFVLPFHGARSDPSRRLPLFPASDPRITIEGFRQAIVDLEDLRRWLLDRGAPGVGVMGMSLGGYTTALWSTVQPELSFAVPMIPLASIADFAREQGRLVGTLAEQDLQHAALEAAHSVVSPTRRKPLLGRDRMLVLAAEGDRITPIEHARKLAAHFDAPVETFAGGHLLQFGRGEAFRAFGRFARRLGVTSDRSG